MKRVLIILGFISLIQGNFCQTFVESKEKHQEAWKTYSVEQFSDSPGYEYTPSNINKYGSNMAFRTIATGFFRTEKINGRWYIIDPDGYPYIHKGIAAVSPGTSNQQKAALTNKWGTNEGWSTHVTRWMKENGFTGSGAWSNVARLRVQDEPIVYSVIINPMSTYRNMHRGLVGGYTNAGWQGYEHNIIRVFDTAFETYMDNACKPLSQYKDDKYLLGYFVDNELPWVNDALDRHLKFLKTDDSGYLAAKNWLNERKGKNAGLEDITQDDRNAFWDFYAGKFFSMAKEYITKYDPNHMFLGARFNQRFEELSNPYIFQTAGKYCDIISINHYREWEPLTYRMENWEKWSSKPFMITEFYTKGEDTGLPNLTGAGWLVKTQNDRGLFYQNFIIKLLKSTGCVGWDWFRYQDNDPEDLTTDPSNRDANKGLVNSKYDNHEDVVALCKYTNDRVYSYLEYFKNKDQDQDSVMVLTPLKDTFVRLLETDNSINGTDQLLRVKNNNGNSYERSALLQFDFKPVVDMLTQDTNIELNIGLIGIYPGSNDPSTVIMQAFQVSDFAFEESHTNTQLLTAYQRRNETLIGNLTIPVNTQSKNKIFQLDVSSLLPFVDDNFFVTIRLQMNVQTETQFEFASRENANIYMRPFVNVKSPVINSATDNQTYPNQIKTYIQSNRLVISGVQAKSHIRIYNLNGDLLHVVQSVSEDDVLIPLNGSWGNVVIVNVVGEKAIKAFI